MAAHYQSSQLFNLYMQITEASQNVGDGAKVGEILVNVIRFSDDWAMIAGTYTAQIKNKKTNMIRISRYERKRRAIVISSTSN